MTVTLPDYVVALSTSDPNYAALNNTVHEYLLKPPGLGGFVEAQIVTFTEPHFVYRIYGGEGKASQCGYWWNIDPPMNSTASYFEQFAVCDEWNDATNMVRCNVPSGFHAVVGTGQSADCANNATIVPDDSVLQLNGNICEIANMDGPGLTCEWCSATTESLQDSVCVEELVGASGDTTTSGATNTACFQKLMVASTILVGAAGTTFLN